jgi:hypothetical protein
MIAIPAVFPPLEPRDQTAALEKLASLGGTVARTNALHFAIPWRFRSSTAISYMSRA